MEQAIYQYFSEEVFFSWIKLTIGLISIAIGAFAFTKWHRIGSGLALTLIAIGSVQLVVGGYIIWRTEMQLSELQLILEQSRAAFIAIEQPRMMEVVENFIFFQRAQIGMALMGLIVLGIGRFCRSPLVIGIGIGFAIFGPLLFIQDFVAADRAAEYLDAVEKFAQSR